ncbi:hypothetical protein [Metaclostridioides mangenotii]|uniref:Uncharacterized protein n=1 Tax=Metaclostridioides mangenotii TaxID=1540 RepID=A0ABS4EBW6_9FIRM|nr:hypothetical protein [Clostridioides mangenotii]MBP1855427.1 hypothetical protein [Clostridioides mangenotii]
MNKSSKRFIVTAMTTMLISTPLLSSVNALESMNDISNNDSLGIELTPEQVKELNEYFPEDTPVSDEEIDRRLIEAGEFTQEELDKINTEYDVEVNSLRNARAVKYINGYNKYRTFKENGKEHLYIYVSGKTLKKIKAGANLSTTFGGFIKNTYVGLAVVAVGSIIGINMNGVNTNYGIVLKYVNDKWNFQGATYTYRYNGWFYQT